MRCFLVFFIFLSSFTLKSQVWPIFPIGSNELSFIGDSLLYKPNLDSVKRQVNQNIYYLDEGIHKPTIHVDSCIFAFGSSILGSKIIENASQITFIFGEDSIKLWRRQNQSLSIFKGDTVIFNYTGLSFASIGANLSDSIETYTLYVPPSAQQILPSSTLQLKLSKSHGLRSFPGVFRRNIGDKVTPQINRTLLETSIKTEVYDFDIGDEFHYEVEASSMDTLNRVTKFENHTILAKNIDSLNLSVSYSILRKSYTKGLTSNFTWVDFISNDTFDLVINNMADPMVNVGSYKTVDFDTYHLIKPLGNSIQNACVITIVLPGSILDSCYFARFDPKVFRQNYALGLGQTLDYYLDCESGNCWRRIRKLIYFKKNSRSEGTPYYVGLEKFSVKILEVYPNPVSGVLHINWDEQQTELKVLRLIDTSGRLVKEKHGPSESPLLWDLSDIKPGLYFLESSHDKGMETLPIYVAAW
jgi:hypothetical protein